MLSESPYVFERTYSKDNYSDAVIIGLDVPEGEKELTIGTVFKDGEALLDTYSNTKVTVKNGKVLKWSDKNITLSPNISICSS